MAALGRSREEQPDALKPATLSDVARLAGVATSTVSRALSNPGRVNAATRGRIEAAAQQLSYVANSSARALSSGRTGAIAVLVPDITNPFYFDIIRGTQQQLRAFGYTQLLVDTEESEELEASLLAKLQQSCDGAILAAPRLSDRRLAAINTVLPLVAINRPRAGIGGVVMDTAQGAEQAIEHLVSLSHQKIVYVAGPKSSWSSERRWRAIQKAGIRLGVEVSRTAPFAPKTTSGSAAADAVLNTDVTACITFNDLLAIAMLERFRERRIAVPGDVSIVGCDDIFGASFCNPPLTTVTAPIEQAGRVAVTILLSRSSLLSPSSLSPQSAANLQCPQAPPVSTVLPTHLTIRQSTGPARTQKGPP